MTNKAEQPTITQADRDVAADIWANYVAKVGEHIVEHQMRNGNLDEGLPSILARHRTTSQAAQDGLVEALERCAQIVEQCNHRQNEKVDDVKYIVRNALSAIKGDKS